MRGGQKHCDRDVHGKAFFQRENDWHLIRVATEEEYVLRSRTIRNSCIHHHFNCNIHVSLLLCPPVCRTGARPFFQRFVETVHDHQARGCLECPPPKRISLMLPRLAVFQFDIFSDLSGEVLNPQVSGSRKVPFDERVKVTPPEPRQTALSFTGPIGRYPVIKIETICVENSPHRCDNST